MASQSHLPIKVVIPRTEDYQRLPAGGGSNKLFAEVDTRFRQGLRDQALEVEEAFSEAFGRYPGAPAVARVALHKDAIAKTHRPTAIFDLDTCPIIGGEGLGSLLVSVRPRGLSQLRSRLLTAHSKRDVSQISTIRSIQPYSVYSSAAGKKTIAPGGVSKFRLFEHLSSAKNRNLLAALETLFHNLDLPVPEQLPQYGTTTY